MDKFFKIKERNSTVRTEIVGGIVTFFAMAYIIFVNPSYLSQTGMNYHAVLLATCIASALGCFLTAFMANVPFAQAPGMGLNAFFTYTICFGMGYTWQQGLAIVLISGVLFLVLMISPIRTKLLKSIPNFLKSAISAGIGLFIALIGMFNVGIISAFGATDSGTAYTSLFSVATPEIILALIGIVITALLLVWKVRGAIFIGIVATTLIGIPMGVTSFAWESVSLSSLGETFFKFDFTGLTSVNGGVLALITAVVSFFVVDCFDTAGTLIGTAANNNMLDKDGNLAGGDRAMIADAIATCTGAALGTSTVTTYVESSTGIAEGARTGLHSVVVGLLFLLACFIAPVAGIIPASATAPALIIVGVYMIAGAAKVKWSDLEEAIPAFLTIVMMPFSYSISNGIGLGFITYSIIKIFRGKAKEVPVMIYIISIVFIVMYVLTYI